MSRSFRTDPTKLITRRRMPDAPAECRIIERRPAKGDIHPLSARQIRRFLPHLDPSYLYGLASIELRPRAGDDLGSPYGEYLNDEKVVRLYSVPFPEWRFPYRCHPDLLEMHGATIAHGGEETLVRWPRLIDLAYFMFSEVLLHELGHHYHRRYRTKRPHPFTPAAKESSANRHALKLARLSAFRKWYEE